MPKNPKQGPDFSADPSARGDRGPLELLYFASELQLI